MIRIEEISKVFHPGTINENLAISNLSLDVEPGDFISVIGSNGAGKSTLFNLIGGGITPSSGKIFIHDKDMTNTPEHRRARYIGRIFQDPTLGTAANMSLEDNMVICAHKGFKGLRYTLNNKKRAEFVEQLKRLDMGLEHRLKDSVGLFSGGQRQSLTLLMMVLSRPDLILLDEHTAALDPMNAEKVMKLTKQFIEEYQLTAMMITHNMEHAINYGNRLIMMDGGTIIYDVRGKEKQELTIEKLVERFRAIKHGEYNNDRDLLS